MGTKKVIAVDFDGTIAVTRYPEIVSMIPQAKIYLRKWRKQGHIIVLWTCREGPTLRDAVNFCEKEGILFDVVNDHHTSFTDQYKNNPRKIGCDIMIDDKFPMNIEMQWELVNNMLKG
jgi:hypothetical protein